MNGKIRTVDSSRSGVVGSVLLICLLAVVVLVPTAARSLQEVPGRDAGVFLYVGWRILDGDIPYQDVWDHKPPLIYYLDASVLFLGRGTLWGVWLIEAFCLCAAASLGFVLMRRAWGALPALFGSAAWLLSLVFIFQYVNVTETYALPLQFLALYLFQQSEARGVYRWRGVVLGAVFAALFLLRQSLVGVPVAIVLYLAIVGIRRRQWRELFSVLGMLVLGWASIVSVCIAYFAAHHSLGSFWDAAFVYNFAYVAAAEERLSAVSSGLWLLSKSGISVLALAGWGCGVLLLRRAGQKNQPGRPLLLVAVIALPVEILLASASGRTFAHYFIPWLPVFGVLSGFFAYIAGGIMRCRFPALFRRVSMPLTRLWMLVLFFCLVSVVTAIRFVPRIARLRADGPWNRAAAWIRQSTTEEDYVLLWGAEANLNFAARRQAPTRFVYQYPLYARGYHNAGHVEEFLRQVSRNAPALIIDTSPSNPDIPPLDAARRKSWHPGKRYAVLPAMGEVFDYIRSNYTRTSKRLGPHRWPVYVKRASTSSPLR